MSDLPSSVEVAMVSQDQSAQSPGSELYEGINRNHHQGDFGEIAVEALCIAAGLNLAKFKRDDGTDYMIRRSGAKRRTAPYLDVQVKSCSVLREVGDFWRYDLDARAFEDLSMVDYQGPPAYLFLVRVPKSQSRYTVAAETGLHLRAATYWLSLEGENDGVRRSTTRTVSVPRANLLTADALAELFDRAAKGLAPTVSEQPRGGI
ncbi:DUF4365 domain-containing protein [Glycomyces dulcitolivorans]|uniref:DUF4365 domain-containing protein n=1 Tax=Glycomyces dulcitolivorans TaxID=2200759 RepID=UPI000DD4BE28|nr:DUF4365 domain-containing protein [Glycomyces dulcitolivorans]